VQVLASWAPGAFDESLVTHMSYGHVQATELFGGCDYGLVIANDSDIAGALSVCVHCMPLPLPLPPQSTPTHQTQHIKPNTHKLKHKQ
jgi:hypothetical protein